MIRLVAALVIGIVVAMASVQLVDMATAHLFAFPQNILELDRVAQAEAMAEVPFVGKLMMVMGWTLAALIGAAVAQALGRRAWAGWTVAGFVALGGFANVLMLPHPFWMQFCAVAGPVAGGWLAVSLGKQVAARRAVTL